MNALPSCTFSARHLQVTVNFGRGLQVVFLHSVFAASAACHFAITSIIIHIRQPPLVGFQSDPASKTSIVASFSAFCRGHRCDWFLCQRRWPEVTVISKGDVPLTYLQWFIHLASMSWHGAKPRTPLRQFWVLVWFLQSEHFRLSTSILGTALAMVMVAS